MIRATTNGVLKSYRSNLMSSFITLNKSRNTVLTQRNFNTYAEDPAAASQAFKLRRARLRTASQIDVSESIVRKFESAWGTLGNISEQVNTQLKSSAWAEVLAGAHDPTAGGRVPLGNALSSVAESVVQSLNSQYADAFIFGGAKELDTPPFELEKHGNGSFTLFYRGLDVSDPKNEDALKELRDEQKFLDVGLGLKEDANGDLIKSSATNTALSGLKYLGFGMDDDDDPKNLVCIIGEMGKMLQNCDPKTGAWTPPDSGDKYDRLAGKLKAASEDLTRSYVELDSQTSFLKANQQRLVDNADTLNEQILGLEQCDLAEAITSFSWAQYCYNAALKMGNSILSQSLMDYMN